MTLPEWTMITLMSSEPSVPSASNLPPVHTAEPSHGVTRAGAMWAALIVGFLVLIVLLVFIAQNTATTPFQFLGWRWSLPLGVAILFAAVAGGLITVAVGAVRIFQLRRVAKRARGR
jgi:uncharacterized integral membrane protein